MGDAPPSCPKLLVAPNSEPNPIPNCRPALRTNSLVHVSSASATTDKPETIPHMPSLIELAPYAVPATLTAIIAGFGPSFLTARRLRADLSTDSEIVERLDGTAQQEMRQEIHRRALVLVCITRFPSLTVYDVLSILGLIGVCALGVVTIRDMMTHESIDPLTHPPMFALISAGSLTCWGAFYIPWNKRAHQRLLFTRKYLGEAAEEDLGQVLRVAHMIAVLGGMVTVGGLMGTYAAASTLALNWGESLATLISTTALMAGVSFLFFIDRKTELGPELQRLTKKGDQMRAAYAADAEAEPATTRGPLATEGKETTPDTETQPRQTP